MIQRVLKIGRWVVEFYFAEKEYDIDTLLDRLWDFGASEQLMRQALDLMSIGAPNTGFTFSNPNDFCAIVAIGPTTSGEEFINTLVHEVHHLAVSIATNLGIDLDGEGPAYISGDSAKELAELVCELGCPCCHKG